MNKILVPCDFSKAAISAFRFAIDMAKKCNGEIILLHVIESSVRSDTDHMPFLSFGEQAYLKEAKGKTENNFDKLITKWAEDGYRINPQLQYGEIATTISNFAKNNNVDLIVMGTKGEAIGFKEILEGSTTEKIIYSARVPVVAIKKYAKNPIKNIILANSLIENEEELLKVANALQNLFGATLHIVYINTRSHSLPVGEINERLDAFVERCMSKDYTVTIYTDLDAESGLINFAKEKKADLIAMVTHAHKGFARLLSPNIVDAIRHHVECPIWTLKI